MSPRSGDHVIRGGRSTASPGAIVKSTLLPWNPDRKSTRLNSSHGYISYAVFCLKKKKTHVHFILGPGTAVALSVEMVANRPDAAPLREFGALLRQMRANSACNL